MNPKDLTGTVEARYLRKSWFLILEHVRRYPDMYFAHLPKDLRSRLSQKSIEHYIQKFPIDQVSFADSLEKDQFIATPDKDPDVMAVAYDAAYRISKTAIGPICTAIYNAGKFHSKRNDSDLPALQKKPVGYDIQKKIHRSLSEFSASPGKKEGTFNIDFLYGYSGVQHEAAKKLIRYSIDKLGEICIDDKDRFDREKDVLEKLLLSVNVGSEFLEETEDQPVVIRPEIKKHSEFWKNTQMLHPLAGTQWIAFERTDAVRQNVLKFGIALNTVEFKQPEDGHLFCEMHNKYYGYENDHPSFSTFKGLASSDNTDFLHVELHRQENYNFPGTSFFTLRLKDLQNQQVMIGHYTYFSPRHDRYLTKSSVWLRFVDTDKLKFPISPNAEPSTSHTEIFFNSYTKDLNPINDKNEFLEIPADIRLYLSDRKLNRLTMPEKAISHLSVGNNSLNKFIEKHHSRIRNDEVLNACCMTFVICYYNGQATINAASKPKAITDDMRVDLLTIRYDPHMAIFQALYTHHLDDKGNYEQYTGSVDHKKNSIEIVLQNKQDKDLAMNTAERNLVFISFSIPNGNKETVREYLKAKPITGIIGGLTDINFIPCSYFIVMGAVDRYIFQAPYVENSGASDLFATPTPNIKITADCKREVIPIFKKYCNGLRIYTGSHLNSDIRTQ